MHKRHWLPILLAISALTAASGHSAPIAFTGSETENVLSDIRQISDSQMAGRASGSHGAKRARQFIAQRFTELELVPVGQLSSLFHPFTYGRAERQGVNVVAALPGCQNAAQLIVVTAHYDHLGQRGGRTYHGADDNASGVAAMLWLAQRLQQHPPEGHCWWFVATDAEESGLYGSEALFTSGLLSPENVYSNLNLDMIARGERGWRLHLSGTREQQTLRKSLERLDLRLRLEHVSSRGPRNTDRSALDTDWHQVSDHGSFVKRGLAHIFIGGMDHPDYHQPSDQWQAINHEYLGEVLQVIGAVADWLNQSLAGAEQTTISSVHP
jgi:Zn-dependent M28 family amino/carboxypeptidase